MNKYYILTFENTHGAISGENLLKQKGIKGDVMPTPTAITKSCGISIRINDLLIEEVKRLINDGDLTIKNMYLRDEDGYKLEEV